MYPTIAHTWPKSESCDLYQRRFAVVTTEFPKGRFTMDKTWMQVKEQRIVHTIGREQKVCTKERHYSARKWMKLFLGMSRNNLCRSFGKHWKFHRCITIHRYYTDWKPICKNNVPNWPNDLASLPYYLFPNIKKWLAKERVY